MDHFDARWLAGWLAGCRPCNTYLLLELRVSFFLSLFLFYYGTKNYKCWVTRGDGDAAAAAV